MKMICWILLLIKLSCCVWAPTFEVNATQSFYQAEEKQNVTLEWTFPPPADGSLTALNVTCWMGFSVLFQLIKGVQVSEIQYEQFAGQVHCDTDVLKEGRLRLHVSSLRTEDLGRYWCNVTIDGNWDYDASFLDVSGSVSAKVGDDVILPVHLKTKLNTSAIKVSWQLNNKVVHTYIHGRDYLDHQNENFKGRTSMFEDEMVEGNVSLRLENVTEEDAGTYTCTVTKDDEKDYNSVSLSVEPRKSPDESKDVTTSPPPTSPPPNKDQSGGLSAGDTSAIVGIVGIVGLIGVILGVFLYKQQSFCRNTQNNRNRGQPGVNREEEIPFQ